MTLSKAFFAWLFCLLSALAQAQSQAIPLAVGSPWSPLALADQHDRRVVLDRPHLRHVLFAAERKPGDWAQSAIESGRQALLASGQMALVLDVSRMPSMITSMFALPSFRERTFPILVARAAEAVATLPRKEGAVTLLTLDAGKVVAVDYAANEAALEQLLARIAPIPQPTTREKP